MTETTITKSVILTVPRQAVWEYLTDRKKLGTWFFEAEADFETGKDYALFETKADGTIEKMVWGNVLEMSPPEKLVYTFTFKPLGGAMTTVVWQLQEAHGGTKLTLTHSGIEAAAGQAAMGLLVALDVGWAKHILTMREIFMPSTDNAT